MSVTDLRHVDSLRIFRYRGMADVGLNSLGAFNLLLGANDICNISMLEAIFMLTDLSMGIIYLTEQAYGSVQLEC